MKTFDTNVVLRVVYQDDPAQAVLAENAWRVTVESEIAHLRFALDRRSHD